MGQKVTPTLPVGVHRLAERIALWRRQRKKRSPMPKELWAAAVSLARVHGVYPIAGALRVNYGGLKKRVAGGWKRGGQRAAEFIELDRVPSLKACPRSILFPMRAHVPPLPGESSPASVGTGSGHCRGCLRVRET